MSLLIDGVEMQVRPNLFFWIAQGKDQGPDARGEDIVLPGVPGRTLGVWTLDGHSLELQGWVIGELLDAPNADAMRAQIDVLKRLMDPSRRSAVTIRDLFEDGQYRTIRARADGPPLPLGRTGDTPDRRRLSFSLQTLDAVWSGVGGVPMDSGYFMDSGEYMDAGEEIVVNPNTGSFVVTIEVKGSARPVDVRAEFTGSNIPTPGLENLSLPEGVVGYTVTGALGSAGVLVVDELARLVERNGANARKDMALRIANRNGEYFALQPGTNEIRILGRPKTFRLRYTPAYL